MITPEHRKPFWAFLVVTAVAAMVLANGLREQAVVVLVQRGAPTALIGALAPDLVLGGRLGLGHAPPLLDEAPSPRALPTGDSATSATSAGPTTTTGSGTPVPGSGSSSGHAQQVADHVTKPSRLASAGPGAGSKQQGGAPVNKHQRGAAKPAGPRPGVAKHAGVTKRQASLLTSGTASTSPRAALKPAPAPKPAPAVHSATGRGSRLAAHRPRPSPSHARPGGGSSIHGSSQGLHELRASVGSHRGNNR